MYTKYYQLKEEPFNITADPEFYFSSACHNEAFSHLAYGIKERKGIVVLTGEIGTGKTTLCRFLLNKLDNNVKTALIVNPSFSDIQLLKLIIEDFGIEGNFKNKFALINAFNHFLLQETSQGNNVVLIIDEAQNLKPRQMEQIRMLSNLETEKQKLLQIILIGQPELNDLLKLPSLRQVNQRVTVRYHLLPLERQELEGYIYHRLKIANASNNFLSQIRFSAEAIDLIYHYSKGVPRMINILCDRCLLAGFTQNLSIIDKHVTEKCCQEVG